MNPRGVGFETWSSVDFFNVFVSGCVVFAAVYLTDRGIARSYSIVVGGRALSNSGLNMEIMGRSRELLQCI